MERVKISEEVFFCYNLNIKGGLIFLEGLLPCFDKIILGTLSSILF